MSDFNTTVIEEFRSNGGKAAGPFEGTTLLLMQTKGAKSGKEIIVPVVYTKDNDKFVIIASKGGAPTNPAWYYNLKKHPEITIEVGTETFKAKADEVTGKERDRLYDQHAKLYPNFNDYKEKTTRVIPLFVLSRV